MKKQASDKSRLFFIEFLIVLFFFLIIGTVCLRVFVAAHSTTRDADALAHAQSTAASIAEVLEAGESIEEYFPEAILISEESSSEAVNAGDRTSGESREESGETTEKSNPGDEGTEEDSVRKAIYEITWDSDFQACDADDAFYTLNLELTTEDHNQTARITVIDRAGDTLYELSAAFHLPLTREEALS
ncbi:MAG: hypothetical protein LUH20_09670 [Lachnospiraceae bacterium]|nr:hypothetical protein [Lachnospiraceae bacterium]